MYDGDNVGENKLITCLQQLEVPYKFTLIQRMEEVRIELASIDKFGSCMLLGKVLLRFPHLTHLSICIDFPQ